jgi:O-antigen/teichoic acid export membrane protein
MLLREDARRPLPLHINLVWTISGNAAAAAAQWLLILVLVRLDSDATVGAFALAAAVVSPVFLMANLHLRTIQATDIANSFGLGTYMVSRVCLTGIAVAAVALCAMFLPRQSAALVPCIAAIKSFEGLSDMIYGFLQKSEHMDRIAKSMILRHAGVLFALTAAVASGLGVTWGLWGGAMASAAVWLRDLRALLNEPDVDRRQLFHSTVADVLRLVRKSLPLGVALLLVSVNANMPRYFLGHLHSAVEVGQFAALGAIGLAANTLIIAGGQALGPSLARAAHDGQRWDFYQRGILLVGGACLLATGLLAAGVLGGGMILEAVYGTEYSKLSSSFVWVLAGCGLSYIASAVGYLLSSAQCFRQQVPMHVGVSATTIVACALAIPSCAIAGAAMAQMAGYAVQVLWSFFLLARLLPLQPFERSERGYSDAAH